ncbi:MAG: tRNA (guanosine(37)-N1)-methyltransferase TrmD [Deltaproteobacteria bacterium GWA2_38_16]|nr:MAG: tRNA (guanosine(37)-N1)-methyltransferase TrmD [Deltaproteobacteria bacterium GWA2_38_16]OGQ03120.1 MAG: tRNA (guanosine(37)-N1)-methyltransferase TrmD [Deltaproteobacteria bacterium RIFCSPHIGHO2_02_FULL_38_15]OGQ33824.1 MAG: tRNA (guanosine(37)-N1)-methyltransferase TrmD [Deltaproteobacteria bacterium RIFCSPLOWO2_01_FULL_38_9]OGQ60199.1 MAG: tRNA (guanosine(37)-N1)-methyltransferase TrmD [Deltaproteobacteria bacterium RIFCSPLOWO2_12_FULL_38_8]HBQ20460.1 tRNA (guanosine(37)-N1)-methyltr
MKFDVVTIFPHMFDHVFEQGVIGKARQKSLLDYRVHNLRDYTTDKHQTVDDVPFGGGGGLIFKIEPLVKALRNIKDPTVKSRTILMSPRGRVFNQEVARELSQVEQVVIFCGRYEGVDERFTEYVDEELSIGDFILTGGEIATMVIMDAVSRFIPGVVGQEEAPYQDSFIDGLLEYPHYTRPTEFEGKKVPEVLRSGHHKEISCWKHEQSINSTLQRRPDLLQKIKSYDRTKD